MQNIRSMAQDMVRQFPCIRHGFLIAQFHEQAVHQRHKDFKQRNIKTDRANGHNSVTVPGDIPVKRIVIRVHNVCNTSVGKHHPFWTSCGTRRINHIG